MADPRITWLARTIRDGGELGPEQRELLADLLYRLSAAGTTAPEARQRHPGNALASAIHEALCGETVATGFGALLAAVDEVPVSVAMPGIVGLDDTTGCPVALDEPIPFVLTEAALGVSCDG